MRVFALSDIHVDYDLNAKWIAGLSVADHQEDVLILAGDVTDSRSLLAWCLGTLARRFKQVLFVPGNHDLWVIRDDHRKNSLQKVEEVSAVAASSGASMQVFRAPRVTIIPLWSWYDYSFGEPGDELRSVWMDYRACRWPDGITETDVAARFASVNEKHSGVAGETIITYSHFLPRVELIPSASTFLRPVLGSTRLDEQVRTLRASIHVYGHSHVQRRVTIDGVSYVNNALGYPSETLSASRGLVCIHEC